MFNLYDEIIVKQDVKYNDILIKKGTIGTIVEILKNKDGVTYYIVELSNDENEIYVYDFEENQITKANN